VDVFYVKDVFGLKIENERKLRQLRDALLAALNNPDDVIPPVPVPPTRKLKRAAAR
jgi:[protein-PII] uridylyltransferase